MIQGPQLGRHTQVWGVWEAEGMLGGVFRSTVSIKETGSRRRKKWGKGLPWQCLGRVSACMAILRRKHH